MSTNDGVKYISVLLGHGPNNEFLLYDSCRATGRNVGNISTGEARTAYPSGVHPLLLVYITKGEGRTNDSMTNVVVTV